MYHISLKDHGKKAVFKPRTYSQDSVKKPRICVAPTIAGCFSAIEWFDVWSDERDTVFIYKNCDNSNVVPCSSEIKDKHITDEHWIHEEATMVLIHAVYPSSELYAKLQNAALVSWAHCMARSPCLDLEAQEKEMGLMKEIFSNTDWGNENMPSRDKSFSFGDLELSLP